MAAYFDAIFVAVSFPLKSSKVESGCKRLPFSQATAISLPSHITECLLSNAGIDAFLLYRDAYTMRANLLWAIPG